jgi:hypothetical protein
MGKIGFLNFELRIGGGKGKEYPVWVVHSPAGEASGRFIRPFTPGQLKGIKTIIELAMLRSRERTRAALAQELRRIRRFGGDLFDALFRDDIRSCYEASLRLAYSQGMGLRIKLRVEPPELVNVPWEFLYEKSARKFLALSIRTTLVRYMEIPYSARPLLVQPPLRFLVMISSPLDYPGLDVGREKRRLQAALKDLESKGLVEFHFMTEATLPALQNRLREQEFHIFHYIGHGGYEEDEGNGVLILENERRGSRPVRGEHLGKLLGDHFSLRLVVLNACEAGRPSALEAGPYDSFSGVAESLVHERIPSVVAMQFEITDEAAILFAREFYAALADNYPVDAAVAEARKAIDYTLKNTVEWATPVLYMRAPDGMIFQVPAKAREEALERKAARLYSHAQEAVTLGRWKYAETLFQQVLVLQPDHREAANTLARVRDELAKGRGLVRTWREAQTLSSRALNFVVRKARVMPARLAFAGLVVSVLLLAVGKRWPNLPLAFSPAPAAAVTATATYAPAIPVTRAAVEPAPPSPTPTMTPSPTPTPLPTVGPTATPMPLPMTSVLSPANLRSGPSTNCPVIAVLLKGTPLEVKGSTVEDDWFLVTTLEGTEGWVKASQIDTSSLPETVFVIGALPPCAAPTASPSPTSPPPTPIRTATPKPTPTALPTAAPSPTPVLPTATPVPTPTPVPPTNTPKPAPTSEPSSPTPEPPSPTPEPPSPTPEPPSPTPEPPTPEPRPPTPTPEPRPPTPTPES